MWESHKQSRDIQSRFLGRIYTQGEVRAQAESRACPYGEGGGEVFRPEHKELEFRWDKESVFRKWD